MPAQEPPENRQRLPNRFTGWRVFGFLLAGVVVLVAALVLRENITGRRALEKARQRWADAGFPLDLEKRRPAPIPDEENFAAVPSLLGILEGDDHGPSRFARPKVERLRALNPKTSGIDANAWDATPPLVPANSPPADEAARAAAEALFQRLNTDQPLIDEWAAALDRPRSQFVGRQRHLDWRDESVDELWSGTAAGLAFQSRAALRAGLKQEAIVRLLAMNRLCDAWRAERSAEALYFSGVFARRMQEVVAEGIATRRWEEPSLARLAPRLTFEVDSALPTAAALWCEDQDRISNQEFQERLLREGFPKRWSGVLPLIPEGVWDHNRATVTNLGFEHFLQPSRRDGARGLSEDDAALRKAIGDARMAPWRWGLPVHRHALFVNRLMYLGRVGGRFESLQVITRLVSFAVAVERFRLAEGRIPDAAAEVVPRFLPAVPLDVDGQPLRFQKRSEGFVIYSVGADGKDSWHGTPPKPSKWPEDWDDDWLLDFSPR